MIVSHGVEVEPGTAELEGPPPVAAVVPEPAPLNVTPAELLSDRLGNVVASMAASVLPEELMGVEELGTMLPPVEPLPHAGTLVELKPQPPVVLALVVPTTGPGVLVVLLLGPLTVVGWGDAESAVPFTVADRVVTGKLLLVIPVPNGRELVELKPQPPIVLPVVPVTDPSVIVELLPDTLTVVG